MTIFPARIFQSVVSIMNTANNYLMRDVCYLCQRSCRLLFDQIVETQGKAHLLTRHSLTRDVAIVPLDVFISAINRSVAPSISFYISPLHIPYGSPKRREDSINFSKGCRYWKIASIHSPCHRNHECWKCRLCRRSPTVIYKSCALRIGTQPSRLLQTISRVLKAIPMTPDRYPVDYSVCYRFFRTYGSEYAKLITKFLFSGKVFSKH